MSYCIKCGAQNADDAKFCTNCGASIPSTTTASSSPAQPPVPPRVQPPVTPASSIPGPVFRQPANPIQDIFRYLAVWGAIIVLIGFFLPWAAAYSYYGNSSVNGFGYAKAVGQAIEYTSGEALGLVFTILIFLIPGSALLFLIGMLINSRSLARAFKLLPLIVFIIFIILIIIGLSSQEGGSGDLSGLKIGLYACLLGSILMAFPLRKL